MNYYEARQRQKAIAMTKTTPEDGYVKITKSAWAARQTAGPVSLFPGKPKKVNDPGFEWEGNVLEFADGLGLKPGDGPIRVTVTVERR